MKSKTLFSPPFFFMLLVLMLPPVSSARSDRQAPDKPAAEMNLEQVDVFVSGEDGYHTYRIPSVIVTKKGTVLAFCEGRKSSRSDSGDIDLLVKRSKDNGKTWSEQQVVWNDGTNTCGNPCPVIDRDTGTIWLLLTHNLGVDRESQIVAGTSQGSRTVWVCHSTDEGLTWTDPIEITSTTKKKNWSWYATGPGVGIQLWHDPYQGRLVVPCDSKTLGDETGYYSHIIYSDDSGKTWKLGGVTEDGVNECQVVERSDGSLLLNMRRSRNNKAKVRATAVSRDGGASWSKLAYDQALIEPRCQASLLTYTTERRHGKNRLLFSNPASSKREKMTVKLSYDEGKTWPVERILYEGSSAYSCLTVLPGQSIGCLYERDDYGKITFARFSLEWLTNGRDSIN